MIESLDLIITSMKATILYVERLTLLLRIVRYKTYIKYRMPIKLSLQTKIFNISFNVNFFLSLI